MKPFMDENFLLDTETARALYFDCAKEQPIFDYHNHLSVRDIAQKRRFADLYELWLETDHYKWRAMRACGIEEARVTGGASPKEKYLAWAAVLPRLVGSPLYHWTHLELQRYFGITTPLCPDTAEAIWEQTRGMLAGDGFDAVSLLVKMKVRVLCTTDDPIDDLTWHRRIAEDETIPFRVLPSFRPDRYLTGTPSSLAENRAALREKYAAVCDEEALSRALDFFCENGCLVSDHGFSVFPYGRDAALTSLLSFLGQEYARRGIAMQLHLGPIRGNSPALLSAYGADAGADSVGETTPPAALSRFLGDLEAKGTLPRTVLYNLNPADNRMLCSMAGNFSPLVQYGAAWWFNDHKRGITEQLSELAEAGMLSSSVGMLTDSRSFTSFVRHEYYRRLLCAFLGRLVEDGEYPCDLPLLGALVSDICFKNAAHFFDPQNFSAEK